MAIPQDFGILAGCYGVSRILPERRMSWGNGRMDRSDQPVAEVGSEVRGSTKPLLGYYNKLYW
jgi:hypothetical protein